MPQVVKCKSVATPELVDALDEGHIGQLLLLVSAIYIWRRAIRLPRASTTDPDDFEQRFRELAMQPVGRLLERRLSHCWK